MFGIYYFFSKCVLYFKEVCASLLTFCFKLHRPCCFFALFTFKNIQKDYLQGELSLLNIELEAQCANCNTNEAKMLARWKLPTSCILLCL